LDSYLDFCLDVEASLFHSICYTIIADAANQSICFDWIPPSFPHRLCSSWFLNCSE
jgi:hypothetical protein